MRRRRRLPRILLNAATAASLALCIATVVLWARSYWQTTTLARYSREYEGAELYTIQCAFRPGRLTLSYSMWGRGGDAEVEYEVVSDAPANYDPDHDVKATRLGFGWLWFDSPRDMNDQFDRVISIPCWALTIIFAFPPVQVLRRRLVQAGEDRALCPTCNYDLRATPERCPECGTAPVGGTA